MSEQTMSEQTMSEQTMSEPKRLPVNYRYDALNWPFIRLMAEIAHLAGTKYGTPEQYTESELTGDRAPVNHIIEHYKSYVSGEPYDQLNGDPAYHLVAIAYNAMMEYYYARRRGTVPCLPVSQTMGDPIPKPTTMESCSGGLPHSS